MPEDIKLWRVGDGDQLLEVASSQLDLEERLEKWLEKDISVLSPDLLVIGRQVRTDYGGIIDLLCIDSEGDLVIVELKRDKTPRDITAQVLDYASWVRDLTFEQLTHMAEKHLRDGKTLEKQFLNAFDKELPEALNSGHSMMIVGSNIDDCTERIVGYLSEDHHVNINAATFQFFREEGGLEFLARVFLIEPEKVRIRDVTDKPNKRKPKLTYEQLETAADEAGVGDLYRAAVEGLSFSFIRKRTQSSAGFETRIGESRNVVFNLLPFASNREEGLRFQAYTVRLSQLSGLPRETIEAALPKPLESWSYANELDEFWHGCTGHFRSLDEIHLFTNRLVGWL